jgi:hypothetical protein
MKNLLVVVFLIPMLSAGEVPSEYVDNGKFFRDKKYTDYYLSENVKYLGKALKSITTSSKAWDECPARVGRYGKSDQELAKQNLSDKWGNFSFWKIDTNKFYTDDDASKFKCSMDVSLVMADYPKSIRDSHKLSGIEDRNMEYWSRWGIAARWKIAADSFKGCGIRIASLELTVMEKTDGSPPDIDVDDPMTRAISTALIERDKSSGRQTLKVGYFRNFKDPTSNAVRGDRKYILASSIGYKKDPSASLVLIKRDMIYAPIRPIGIPEDHLSHVIEAHELFHTLADKNGKESHVISDEHQDTYNQMSDAIVRTSGTFTEEQCDEMIKGGVRQGFLKCN